LLFILLSVERTESKKQSAFGKFCVDKNLLHSKLFVSAAMEIIPPCFVSFRPLTEKK